MNKSFWLFVASLAVTPLSYPVETKTWVQNEKADFEKGTLKNLSLRSDGRLTLAPVFQQVFDSSVPYLWALAVDSKGNLYTGGGGPGSSMAKLFAVDPSGKARMLAELPGMQVQAIAIDRNDRVYAATAPDGKVYRVAQDGKYEEFYDPEAKYIWALQFNSKGDLFVATGDSGEIHRVTPDGKGDIFFRTEETHARSLAMDAQDNLLVGTEPGGLIVRVTPSGEGFVLYQAAKREVTAVAVAKDGTIYAAAVGNKGPAPPPAPARPAPAPTATPRPVQTMPAAAKLAPLTGGPAQPARPPAPAVSIAGGSEVYRIGKDNYPQDVWSHPEDVVYTIGFDWRGRPIVGTGNQGNIYRIDSDIESTLLINAAATQVTAFVSSGKGRLYAATGNIGRVYQIGPAYEKEGTYESEPFDVGSFAYWGRLHYRGTTDRGKLVFETHSGNLDRPQKNWSEWAAVDMSGDGRVVSPSARFLQYRITFAATEQGQSPEVTEVDIAYMPKNAAPIVEKIEMTPPDYRYPAVNPPASPSQTLTLPPMGQKKQPGPSVAVENLSTGQSMQYAQGYIGARWAASDPNSDEMLYKVEIRGVEESDWKLLRDQVREKYMSWDSTAYADGEYQLRVTASDAPGNPPEKALTGQLVSDQFALDNTAPVIVDLKAIRNGDKLTAQWKAKDARSVIKLTEYSLNGGDWTVVEPTTRLSDAREHDYTLAVSSASKGENTIAVRVTDDLGNQVVEKTVVR